MLGLCILPMPAPDWIVLCFSPVTCTQAPSLPSNMEPPPAFAAGDLRPHVSFAPTLTELSYTTPSYVPSMPMAHRPPEPQPQPGRWMEKDPNEYMDMTRQAPKMHNTTIVVCLSAGLRGG